MLFLYEHEHIGKSIYKIYISVPLMRFLPQRLLVIWNLYFVCKSYAVSKDSYLGSIL